MIQKKKLQDGATDGYGEFLFTLEKLPLKTAAVSAAAHDAFSTVADLGMFLQENKVTTSSFTADCFACDIARLLLDFIGIKSVKLNEGALPDSFYKKVLDAAEAEGLLEQTAGDKDLLHINLKQMIHILRASGLVSDQNGKAVAAEKDISDNSLYFRLLNSFWNFVPWEDIFPSDEEAAMALHEDRLIMRDLLLKKDDFVSVDDLTNEFCELTGFSEKNNLILISFIDFYLYTWLKHFNILRYRKSKGKVPVTLALTEEGRRLLATCNN